MWGMMVKSVYADGRQYNSIEALQEAVFEAWENISENYIADIIDSMKERIFNVIFAHGGHSGY
jgi:hypothetical protein